ncbi:MAG: hypothetical protein WAS05_01845 [Candidatus Nanopelagicales bacterium]
MKTRRSNLKKITAVVTAAAAVVALSACSNHKGHTTPTPTPTASATN